MKKRILEICVDSLQSALIAQQAGADRIELCSCLEVGGVTPDPAMFTLAREKLTIPIHVLIRPRIGNFLYDAFEHQVIIKSIEFFRDNGADSLVIGALTDQNEIDTVSLEEYISVAENLPLTFHRAFDQADDPKTAIGELKKFKVERLLTSGQKATAVAGKNLLRELHQLAGENIKVMAGSGVNSTNVVQVLETGVTEIHASARVSEKEISGNSNKVGLSTLASDNYRLANYEEIVKLRNIIDKY